MRNAAASASEHLSGGVRLDERLDVSGSQGLSVALAGHDDAGILRVMRSLSPA